MSHSDLALAASHYGFLRPTDSISFK